MPLFRQLEFAFRRSTAVAASLWDASRFAQRSGYRKDVDLELMARELLRANGAHKMANQVHVEWSSRLKTCAGRADHRANLISLNPRLRDHSGEVDRTLRHELAHLLAQFRAGRRRSEEHTSELQSPCNLVCRLLLEKKKENSMT